jgi:hypothetical protein
MKRFIIVLFSRYFKDAHIKKFVACIGETSNACKILDTKSEKKRPLQTLQPPQKFERPPFWKD